MAKSNHTKPRKKGGALKILLVVLVLLVLAAGAALLLAKREIDGSGEQEEAVTVEIAQGSGVACHVLRSRRSDARWRCWR